MKFQADAGQFFESIHTLDVQLTLSIARDRDLQRTIPPNDLRDLYWLGIAIPYAKLVVTENHWGNLVRANHLETKYGTVVEFQRP